MRDERLLPLETAIRKMTGASARALGLADRGLIREGFRADIAVFDPDTVAERASFNDPHQYADGFAHVLVNGIAVIADGEHTGALPGKVLRRAGP